MATLYAPKDSPYWYLHYIDDDGKRQRKPIGIRHNGKRKKPCQEALDFLRDWETKQARIKAGLEVAIEPITTKEFWPLFLANHDGRDSTKHGLECAFDRFQQWLETQSISYVHELTPAVAARFREYLGSKKGHGDRKGLRNNSIRVELGKIRAALNYARKLHHIAFPDEASNPFHTEMPVEKSPRQPFTFAELNLILNELQPEWLRTCCWISAYTGVRQQSCRELSWEDMVLDIEVPIIRFQTKTTPVTLPAAKPLAKYLRAARVGKTGKVVERETCLDAASFSWWFRKACCDLGIRDGKFHRMRHSFATALAYGGVPKRIAAKLCNHREEDMQDLYEHMEAQELAGHLDQLDFSKLGSSKLVLAEQAPAQSAGNVVRLPGLTLATPAQAPALAAGE